ncbi:MAG: energy transducer TonB [Bryobacterales bacterium]|nr:energy transducer TonB [Bryobacterales bacterium]
MFEQSVVNRKSERRPLAMLLSLAMQTSLLILALLMPLVFSDILPAAQLSTMFVLPALPVVRAAEPAPPPDATVQRVKVKQVATNVFTAPSVIPKKVAHIVEEIEIDPHLAQLANQLPMGVGANRIGGAGVSGLESLLTGTEVVAPPPPVEAKPKPKEIIRVRRGGEVVEAMAISRPGPAYPELAKRARVQGDVQLNAIIGADGSIRELRVQSGHPLLVRAAVEAVSQWRYRPTMLNGDPVEVITQITVTFRLR